MFYSTQILARKGPLGLVWIAAHMDRQLKRNQIFEASIPGTVDAMLNSEAPLALRLTGQLLLGVVRIYSRKIAYLHQDCNDALIKIRLAFKPNSNSVVLEVAGEGHIGSITIPDEFFDIMDMELMMGGAYMGAPQLGRMSISSGMEPSSARKRKRGRNGVEASSTLTGAVSTDSLFGAVIMSQSQSQNQVLRRRSMSQQPPIIDEHEMDEEEAVFEHSDPLPFDLDDIEVERLRAAPTNSGHGPQHRVSDIMMAAAGSPPNVQLHSANHPHDDSARRTTRGRTLMAPAMSGEGDAADALPNGSPHESNVGRSMHDRDIGSVEGGAAAGLPPGSPHESNVGSGRGGTPAALPTGSPHESEVGSVEQLMGEPVYGALSGGGMNPLAMMGGGTPGRMALETMGSYTPESVHAGEPFMSQAKSAAEAPRSALAPPSSGPPAAPSSAGGATPMDLDLGVPDLDGGSLPDIEFDVGETPGSEVDADAGMVAVLPGGTNTKSQHPAISPFEPLASQQLPPRAPPAAAVPLRAVPVATNARSAASALLSGPKRHLGLDPAGALISSKAARSLLSDRRPLMVPRGMTGRGGGVGASVGVAPGGGRVSSQAGEVKRMRMTPWQSFANLADAEEMMLHGCCSETTAMDSQLASLFKEAASSFMRKPAVAAAAAINPAGADTAADMCPAATSIDRHPSPRDALLPSPHSPEGAGSPSQPHVAEDASPQLQAVAEHVAEDSQVAEDVSLQSQLVAEQGDGADAGASHGQGACLPEPGPQDLASELDAIDNNNENSNDDNISQQLLQERQQRQELQPFGEADVLRPLSLNSPLPQPSPFRLAKSSQAAARQDENRTGKDIEQPAVKCSTHALAATSDPAATSTHALAATSDPAAHDLGASASPWLGATPGGSLGLGPNSEGGSAPASQWPLTGQQGGPVDFVHSPAGSNGLGLGSQLVPTSGSSQRGWNSSGSIPSSQPIQDDAAGFTQRTRHVLSQLQASHAVMTQQLMIALPSQGALSESQRQGKGEAGATQAPVAAAAAAVLSQGTSQPLSQLVEGKNRLDASRWFFEMLVLKSRGMVELEQQEQQEEILVTLTQKALTQGAATQ